MSKQTDGDAALCKLLGIGGNGFSGEALAEVAFTLAAVIEEMGIEPAKLVAAKQKAIARLTETRTLLQRQQSEENIRYIKERADRMERQAQEQADGYQVVQG